MPLTRLFLLAFSALLIAAPARADPDDGWAENFYPAGTNGTVWATAEYQGDLIALGTMSRMGADAVLKVARWNGAGWDALTADFPGGPRETTPWDGKLVIGGYECGVHTWDGDAFTSLNWNLGTTSYALTDFDGTLVVDSARWTGSVWALLDGSADGDFHAAAVYQGDLYLGGGFSEIGGVPATGIARWDGSGFHAVGGGAWGAAWGYTVRDLRVWNGLLVACGVFHGMDGQSMPCVAAWDGASWSGLGDGLSEGYLDHTTDPPIQVDPEAFTLGEYQGDLMVGGIFGMADGLEAHGLARWDGVVWTAFPGDLGGVGPFRRVEDFTEHAGELWIAGPFDYCGGTFSPHLMRFDGAEWKGIGGDGVDYGIYDLCDFEGDMIAGGALSGAGRTHVRNVARWNGVAWEGMGENLDRFVFALTAAGDSLFAAGLFEGCVARWDGADWQVLGAGLTYPEGDDDPVVRALAPLGEGLVAAGSFDGGAGVSARRIAYWDGAAWQDIGGINADDGYGSDHAVSDLLTFEGAVIVAGNFTDAGGLPASNLARWDGESWDDLGGGLPGTVFALGSHGGALYASARVGGQPGLHRWTGLGWELFVELDAAPNDIDSFGGRLVLAGNFDTVGGEALPHLACWDGAGWSGFGSGTDAAVNSLAVLGDRLYVAGSFDSAGGKFARGFSCWTETLTASARPPSVSRLERAWPNPFNPATRLVFALENPGLAELAIFDAQGRRLRTLASGWFPAGEHTFAWDGCDGAGRRQASGAYVARLSADGIVAAEKLMLLK